MRVPVQLVWLPAVGMLLVGAVVNRKLAPGIETCPGAAAESTVDD